MKKIWSKFLSLFTSRKKRPYVSQMPMNLQFFGGDGGGSGDNPGGDGGGDGGQGGDTYFATFKTESEFNDKLSAAEKEGQLILAKSLGFESVEDMQVALKEQNAQQKKPQQQKKDDDNSVDVEQLVEEKLKDRMKEQEERTFKRLLTAEVKIQANELGFADWEDALALADLKEVKEDDKGNLLGVKEALETLAKNKPHLIKTKTGNGSFGATVPNARKQQPTSKEEIIKLAQNRGFGADNQAAHDPWAKN
ncbi:hypothetical protein BEP19_14890 [Ammoniphilus oxalaticus]|uniref:Scaffolding protein n=2 Tax=Ammoniphilus oxalaticus TaxID=66863 RepID=A0A419SDG2_9BACL|nr:hypothetical protein BEP19_14890 [Ammoniphilus oxalaticus]